MPTRRGAGTAGCDAAVSAARRPARPGHGAVVARESLRMGPYEVELTRKNIRSAWLRVTTPDGPLQVSAPARMARARVEEFVLGRRAWVERRRAELADRDVQQGARTGHVGEGNLVTLWGRPVPLAQVVRLAADARSRGEGRPVRAITPDTGDADACDRAARRALSTLLLEAAEPLVAAHEARMGVSCAGLRVRDARSRWGSCNVRTHVIMLALSLTHYPKECLELICVHELCHLRERGHGPAFRALMDAYLPDWREREALLRRLSQGR